MDTGYISKIHDEHMATLNEVIEYLHEIKNLSETKAEKKTFKKYAAAARYAYTRLGKERPMLPSYYGYCERCGGDVLSKDKPYDYCPWCGQRIARYVPLSYEMYRPEITRFYTEENNYDHSNDYIPKSDRQTDKQSFQLPQYILDAFSERQDVSEEGGEYDGWDFDED